MPLVLLVDSVFSYKRDLDLDVGDLIAAVDCGLGDVVSDTMGFDYRVSIVTMILTFNLTWMMLLLISELVMVRLMLVMMVLVLVMPIMTSTLRQRKVLIVLKLARFYQLQK